MTLVFVTGLLLAAGSVQAGSIWDGGGGTTSIDLNTNWDSDSVNALDGTTAATFGTGGSTATINVPANFTGITFNRDASFTLADGAGTLTIGTDGINAAIPSTVSRTYTISENSLVLGGDQTWTTTTNGAGVTTLAVSSLISGGYNLSKAGGGTLNLTNANTYTGKTTVNAGKVSFTTLANAGSACALGAPSVANATIDLGSGANSATLEYSIGTAANATSDRIINLAGTTGGATISFTSATSGTLTLNGNVTATGSGTKTLSTSFGNNGTVVFNGTITDSAGGATSLNHGVAGGGTTALTLGNTNNSYSGKTTISRGTLTFSSIKNVGGGNSSLGAPTTVANGTIDIGTGNNVTFSYTGGGSTTDRVLNLAGSLNLSSSGGLLRFTSDLTAVSGNKTITLGNNVQLDGAISDPTGSGIISLSISNGNGASTLTSTSNSFSGTITIANANLYIASIPNGGAIKTASGSGQQGTLIYTGTGGTNNRPVQLNGSAGTTISQSGSGLLKFTGALTAITASSNPLTLQGSTAGSGEISGVISNGAATAINITKAGTGTWTLSGTNTYSGTTKVSAGTLRAGIASVAGYGAFGTNSAVTLDNVAGVVLDLNGYNTAIGSLAGGGTSGGNVTLGTNTLTIGSNNTSPAAFAGIISGTGGNLVKVGTGTNTLSGVNTYTGTTTVNVGTLQTAVSNCLNTASSVVIANGAKMYLNFTDTNTITSLKLGGIGMNKGVYNASNQSTFLTGSGALKVTTSPANGTLISFF